MIATVDYVQKRFAEFNQLCFGGQLPELPVVLSRSATALGSLNYRRRRLPGGRVEKSDYSLHISTRVDLPEAELEDIILHEMIHYYIAYNRLPDTSPHGKLFRQKMEEINIRYGRHISVRFDPTEEQREQMVDKRRRWHVVAVVQMADGKVGFKVLPRVAQRLLDYYNGVRRNPAVVSVEMHLTDNIFFNRYPTSSVLSVHWSTLPELREQLQGALPVECDGRKVRVIEK